MSALCDFAVSVEQTNIQTPANILATSWFTVQDMSVEPLFGLLTQADMLKTKEQWLHVDHLILLNISEYCG